MGRNLLRPFAGRHNPGHAKRVVENLHRVADLDVLRLGQDVIDQDVVRPLERSALHESEMGPAPRNS